MALPPPLTRKFLVSEGVSDALLVLGPKEVHLSAIEMTSQHAKEE